MTLFLPVACPGSGKSTLAAHMVSNDFISEDAVVSPDRYREILTNDRTNQKCNKTVFEIVDRIVDSRILHGLDVYLDGTNLNAKLRNRLLNRVTALSYDFSPEIVILVSDAPRRLVERRNLDRQFPVPQDVFDRFATLQEEVTLETIMNECGLLNPRIFSIEEVLEDLSMLTV
jgi:predicted kinase